MGRPSYGGIFVINTWVKLRDYGYSGMHDGKAVLIDRRPAPLPWRRSAEAMALLANAAIPFSPSRHRSLSFDHSLTERLTLSL